jgi:N-acetylglucosamine-6-phosphate deacetylase
MADRPPPVVSSFAASPEGAPLSDGFDLQVNGFAGVDFQQDDLTLEALRHAVAALRRHGTRRILFTLITDRIDGLCRRLARAEDLRAACPELADAVAGYHLEGPHLCPEPGYAGAHPPQWMRPPSIGDFSLLQEAARGNVRLITLAPELPDAPACIRHLTTCGIRVAIGHSQASDAQLDAAIAAGLSLCTHLGNGVPHTLPRHDNVIQRLLARDELFATFIPDGIHLPPFVLRNFVRAKPRERVLFTTDAMAAAGAPPGRYRIGPIETEVGADGVVRLPGETRYFAGSSLTLDAGCRNVVRWLGWSPAEAAAACGARVAAYLGLPQ